MGGIACFSWDYNIRELALYDLPAVVEHVKKESRCRKNVASMRHTTDRLVDAAGYDKVAFIGHSQGNATMFVSLGKHS